MRLKETFVEHFGHNADVSVGVRCGYEGWIDVGYPEFAEGSVESWQDESADVEEESAGVAGSCETEVLAFALWWLSIILGIIWYIS